MEGVEQKIEMPAEDGGGSDLHKIKSAGSSLHLQA
jgi:hypothetical protein